MSDLPLSQNQSPDEASPIDPKTQVGDGVKQHFDASTQVGDGVKQHFDASTQAGKSEKQHLVVVSGYFNPFHIGHLDLFEEGAKAGDKLLVIVNNDAQQMLKKGKIIMPEQDRLRIVQAIGIVDKAILAVDNDPTVCATLEVVGSQYRDYHITFGNGGDRKQPADVPEYDVCKRFGIHMVFDMGGNEKADSSTRINRATGYETIG